MEFKDMGMYIEDGRLGKFAENTARSFEIKGKADLMRAASETASAIRAIREASRRAERDIKNSLFAPKEAEWLADNQYLADHCGKNAVRELREVPKLPAVRGKRPAVMEAAGELIRAGRGAVTEKRIEIFLGSFRNILPLTEEELFAFVPCIKAAAVLLLEQVCRAKAGDGEVFMENLFTTLRHFDGCDPAELIARVNPVERAFMKDSVYPLMDEATRAVYRRETARIAKKRGLSETEAAEKIVKLAAGKSHIGRYIFEEPLGEQKRHGSGWRYILLNLGVSIFITLLLGFLVRDFYITALLLLPVSETVKNTADYIILRIVPPRPVARMEFKGGVPEEEKTLCVIACMLTEGGSGAKYAGLLEKYRLLNRDSGENLAFGLLCDFPESKDKFLPGAGNWLNSAADAVNGLNGKYGGGFYLFYRDRVYSERDGRWMGRERKRGALMELARLLRNGDSEVKISAGDAGGLKNVKYIITLDGDTCLTAGSARELIGAAAHPLNRPVISEENTVIRGHGILQPRIAAGLESAGKTCFSRLTAGQGGVEPYETSASDLYHDLFSRGTYTGKGIIHIDAYLRCLTGRFPENSVLSHDLLEGAYLRAGYLGSTELTDGCPSSALGYYERQRRWVRGDWQTAPWLFGRVKNGAGAREKNPLGPVDRWKIADNLRRSLVPVFTFGSLGVGMLLSGRGFILAAAVAVISAVSRLLLQSAGVLIERNPNTGAKYYSNIVPGFKGAAAITALELLFLPYSAYVNFCAVFTALWRMLISRKNMLQWVTSDVSDGKKAGVLKYFGKMWAASAHGLVLIIFSPYIPAKIAGLIWFLSPVFGWYMSVERPRTVKLRERDRLELTRMAGDIWRYFREFVTPEDCFLPPDNFQEEPPAGKARRTSPTNIGLCLLSGLAAMDLGLEDRENGMKFIENVLNTVEKLPKWRGHLYNWYSTETLDILEPGYVSTVDSGNFAACLTALREGLLERGETDTAARIDGLLGGMDFSELYDEKKKLFYIGYDIKAGGCTQGWYDLMASEARLTSYFAVARGDVERKHWRRLSRILVSKDRYRGMASWTGTMFEYMMPQLLLPCPENSLIYESVKFCVHAQKKAAGSRPWGVSESGFYAFDPALSYRYKAHGTQALALKRGMDSDYVASPYSTFLALDLGVESALKNLRALKSLGAEGRCGFYEAVDMTPSRMENGRPEVVKSYMSHHLGMSLIAIDNRLNRGVMRRRFMRDASMGAYREILEEKVPVGEPVLRRPEHDDIPEKPRNFGESQWKTEPAAVNCPKPRCTLLSGKNYDVLFTETGMSRSLWRGELAARFSPEPFSSDCGISFFVRRGENLTPLYPAPLFDKNTEYYPVLTGRFGAVTAKNGGLRAYTAVYVPEGESGEVREISLTNLGETGEMELICRFRPVLQRPEDYYAHPAFSDLKTVSELYNGALLFRKRGGDMHLCLACGENARFSAFREAEINGAELFGDTVEPCAMAIVRLRIEKGGEKKVRFAISAGASRENAFETAGRLLKMREGLLNRKMENTARFLGLGPKGTSEAMELLRRLAFPGAGEGSEGREGLWRFGISGDVPVLAIEVDKKNIQPAADAICRHTLLTNCGFKCDLALILPDGGDYRRPVRTCLEGVIRVLGREGDGDIHLIDAVQDVSPVLEAAAAVYGSLEKIDGGGEMPDISRRAPAGEGKVSWEWLSDGSFRFCMDNALPERSWSHILTNGSFGFIASDRGTGHMWEKNARENKINRWLNDSVTSEGTERLEAELGGERKSLFGEGRGKCIVTYGFGFARWEREAFGGRIKTTAFIPLHTDARVLIIEPEGLPEGVKLRYYTDLVMGSDERAARFTKVRFQDGVFTAWNPWNRDFPGTRFSLAMSEPVLTTALNKTAWLMGKGYPAPIYGGEPCFGAETALSGKTVIACGCCGRDELLGLLSGDAAERALEDTLKYWSEKLGSFEVKTGFPELDNYLNGWALYQTIACRLMARTSIYQSGGAYGFRDQLQDAVNIILVWPEKAREQIIRAAGHQYEAGDVQHWWHSTDAGDRGVRTRMSDDLLWLPYAVCRYVEMTGDRGILDVPVPYLRSPELKKGEKDRYESPENTDYREDIYCHIKKAVEKAAARSVGEHGLCLMGAGDWNDGMDRAGAGGRGESVWLTWFFAVVLRKMAELTGDGKYKDMADRYRAAAENAWDGAWYKRGWFDGGEPMGSRDSAENRIDSIAQSFAVFAGGENSEAAVKSALDSLFDREHRLVKLFTPAFNGQGPDPGYIKDYGPGFRENGGQYTHGAVWLAMACLRAGMVQEGAELLRAVLPGGRDEKIYKTEPYVLAADIYSNPAHVGRGGWTWYTGAAGWYFRACAEELLGLKMRNGRLFIEPNLPKGMDGYTAGLLGHVIEVRAGKITVDGKPWDGSGIFSGIYNNLISNV